MKKTRLLFVMGLMRVGGIEKSLIRLCKALDCKKYDISVLLLSVGDGISDELPYYVRKIFVSRNKTRSFEKQYSKFWCKHYEKIVENAYSHGNKMKRRLNYELLKYESVMFKKYVKDLFCNENFDVSIGFMQGEPSDVAVNCINAKKRIVFYRHGTVFEFMNDTYYYEKADIIVALSKGVKEDLIKDRHICDNKIRIIHNVYDIENIRNLSNQPCEYDKVKKLKLVTVARISPEKGILQAIRSARILKEKGMSFLWLFVGNDDGDYAEKCKREINDNGLNDIIIFTGVKSNPYPFIRTADIFVQPSECEALPGTIVEALVLGKPIVSTKTYGAQELIIHKKNGLLCGFEPMDLADSIEYLKDNTKLKNSILIGAREKLREFNDEIIHYEDLFSCE